MRVLRALVHVTFLGYYFVMPVTTLLTDWKDRDRYYYPDLRVKLSELLTGQQECIEKAVIAEDHDDSVPLSGALRR